MSKITSHLYQSLAQLVEARHHVLDGNSHVKKSFHPPGLEPRPRGLIIPIKGLKCVLSHMTGLRGKKANALFSASHITSYWVRLLQNPPDAAPDGLRPRGFVRFFAEAAGPTLNKRTRQGHRCGFRPFSGRRRRPRPVAGGFAEVGVRLDQVQASILSICSAAMTSKPKARCAATLTGPRTRTCRPPCSSCRWLLTRSTAVRSL